MPWKFSKRKCRMSAFLRVDEFFKMNFVDFGLINPIKETSGLYCDQFL
jgi:hypothetical protein